MKLETQTHDGVTLITALEPRIDAAVAIQFKDTMREVTESAQTRFVIDMSNVEFVDSSGLGAIVSVMKMVGPDRQLELAGLTPNVEKVFRLTRMDTVFTIHPHIGDAIDTSGLPN